MVFLTICSSRVAAASVETPYDHVVESVSASLEQQQVRRCLQGLTDLQWEATGLLTPLPS